MIKKILYGLATLGSSALVLGSWIQILPMSLTEVFGFITGAICVWLTVKQNIWSWPIGIANNIFFIFLFLQVGLYADTGLQVVYIVLAILGWYWWLKGGVKKTKLAVSHISITTSLVLTIIGVISTYWMMLYLQSINDSAPFLDALTTVMSLIAQFMLTKKYLENWYIWIAADVIYVYLYFSKDLSLTAVLYFIFLCMCIAGLTQWQKSMKVKKGSAIEKQGLAATS
jgi:nicotinamide mononucleotide transporter